MPTYRVMWNRPGSADPGNKLVIVQAESEGDAAWKAAEMTFDAVHPSGRQLVLVQLVPDRTVEHADMLAGDALDHHLRADHRPTWRLMGSRRDWTAADWHHSAHHLLNSM